MQEKSRPFIVTGRTQERVVETGFGELEELLGGGVGHGIQETIGDVATILMTLKNTAGLIVVQSAVGS